MFKKNLIVVFLMSMSLMMIELAWTRIFSAEFFYTFAFLILSLAVLGLGLGALIFKLFNLGKYKHFFFITIMLTALFALISPPTVFTLNLDFTKLFSDSASIFKIIAAVLLLSSTYICGGTALAYIFKSEYANISKIYMSDLIGASLGVVLSISLMQLIGTPMTVFIASVPLIISAVIVGEKYLRYAPIILVFFMGFLCLKSDNLLEAKRKEHGPVIYKHWDALSKLKIFEFGDARGINIDNTANTPVSKFDGNFNVPDSMKMDFAVNVRHLIHRKKDCSFLSIGSGGGGDILMALQEGAKDIYAVEINPHINYLIKDGFLKQYSGNIYNNPKVKVITEDARSYIRGYENKFDVLYSFSSNTFAALASGAFAMAENYVYTTEAIEDYLKSLKPEGYIIIEHQMYIPRITASAIEALKNIGINNYKDYLTVYELTKLRRQVIVISNSPMNDEIRQKAILEYYKGNTDFITMLYPNVTGKRNLIVDIVEKGWNNIQNTSKINISPTYDDKPFIAQMGLMKNVDFSKTKEVSPFEFRGFPLSKIIVMIVMLVALVIFTPVTLIPYLIRKNRTTKLKGLSYFFFIGIAFMAVEVVLIQRYNLFIGASAYSTIVILLTLLLSSGIGSGFSDKLDDNKSFTILIALILFEGFVSGLITNNLTHLSIYLRMIVSSVLIMPLGFFMGMPFPKGIKSIAEGADWGFAVNGIASVIGSAGIVLCSFEFGFTYSIVFAALMYFIAYFLLNKKSYTI